MAPAAPRPPPPAAPQPRPPQPLPPAPLSQAQVQTAEPPPFQAEDWLPNWDQGASQAADWPVGYGDYWESDGEGQAGGATEWEPVGPASSRAPGGRGTGSSSSQQGAAPVLSDVRLFIRNLSVDSTQQALIRTFSK